MSRNYYNICDVIITSAPSVAPTITVSRISPTVIIVSWKPLTLSEARGFITFYIIEYYPSLNIKKRQAPSDIMRVSVSADSSNAITNGLDEDLNYFVQVSASTSAGGGVVSSPYEAQFSKGSTGVVGSVVGGVVGGVVAVVLIIAVTVIILARSRQTIMKPTE